MSTSPPALRVRRLTRCYGAKMVVSNLDIEVQAGDLYGFLGPNGSGKTTAIRCILGLIRKDAGEVEIFGERDPIRQRRSVGAMVETPRFYEWLSGRKNLELAAAFAGPGVDASDLTRVLERVGLADRAGEAVRGYSLGMKQRLGIARALLGRPKLLVLDEPTNGLDPRGMREVRDLVQELVASDGLTVFISSHLLAEIQAMCNRVGILDRGVLRREGGVRELMEEATEGSWVELAIPEDARAVVERMPEVVVKGVTPEGRLKVKLGELPAAALNQRLVAAGVPVSAIIPITRSLEDVFLQQTLPGVEEPGR